MTSPLGQKMLQKVSDLSKNATMPARAIFKSQVRLDAGTQCSAFVRKFPAMIVDEPPELGGNDAGANPVELLLSSLGTCQAIVYSLYANVMGIELESVTVDVKGQLDIRGLFGVDLSIPPGFQDISFETRITSSADAATIQELSRVVEARCPTLDTLTRKVPVTGRLFLNGEAV
ncbi:putative OsmC-like protein [Panacagrimonas perspica]|uniref:Putative OsmC-like protein n=1 Tax=Panacagrimonas perspica TaxID=381431 RepID=A0A4S3K2F2_9GAMM|nr:OsmC family protein [Panacagrimonas perspica]TDU26473.1 putative OsmC-like protein [Panacagrimonas perspica]THD02163.1 osmotically inducible protein OsmC [Panacagrimonas perspica]